MCDDDCGRCGARHMSPYDVDDLTTIVEQQGGEFVVLQSPQSAGHSADYREVGRFANRKKAEAFLESCD